LNEDENSEKRSVEATSDEDSDADEEDGRDEGRFVDVLDVFDGKAEADNDSNAEPPAHPQTMGKEEEMAYETEASSDNDEDYESDDEPILPSDTEDTPEAIDELRNFITSLDSGQKRKAEESTNDRDSRPTQKRRVLRERTEAGPESTFGGQISSVYSISTTGTCVSNLYIYIYLGSSKLKLDDLLAPLTSHSTLQSLKSSIRPLTSSNSQPLIAPLPQRTQERLDREAAYEQTKEEVKKWNETMKMIKDVRMIFFLTLLFSYVMFYTGGASELPSSVSACHKNIKSRAYSQVQGFKPLFPNIPNISYFDHSPLRRWRVVLIGFSSPLKCVMKTCR
jgi:U3 small nucleolar RNA-associated protein 14